MTDLAGLVAAAHAAWEPRLARAVFGTDDAEQVARADPLPTPEQVDGFVADYEAAAGVALDPVLVTAGQRWAAAYGARCMHSDAVLGIVPDIDPTRGWPRLLRQLLAR